MSTPYDRAKPPRPQPVELRGCRVCGADPTHFSTGTKPLVPLCAGCDSIDGLIALPYAVGAVFVLPVPPQFLVMLAFIAGLTVFCAWVSR